MSLSLDNSILTDSGRYQCIVSNKFGQLNRTFDIEVIGKFKDSFYLLSFICFYMFISFI